MYTLKCKELDPAGNCDFSATSETKEEVIKNIMKHAMENHAGKMAAMSADDKLAMEKKMHEILKSQDPM
jgi:predicted small metal-binding protein